MNVDIGRVVPLHRGEYNGSTTYEINDIVSYEGKTYWHAAQNATTGVSPDNSSTWKLVADVGDLPGMAAESKQNADRATAAAQQAANDAAAVQSAAQTVQQQSQAATAAATSAAASKDAATKAETAAETAKTGAEAAQTIAVQKAKELSDSVDTINQLSGEIAAYGLAVVDGALCVKFEEG